MYRSVTLPPPSPPLERPLGGCSGPLVAQLFDDFSGSDARLDYSEAAEIGHAIDRHLLSTDKCGLQVCSQTS